ncbi:AAA family ATPase [Synechococcus sp. A10-1-5-9]|uniref:AAA family ATPase n=1 Tax=Synechococcus sp. A10-1-5-9 TaxID=3392295 RepID=UPI0039E7DDFF
MGFEIRDHLAKLQPDGGTNTPNGDHSFLCPVPGCGAPNFKVNLGTGKWAAYGCKCSSTEKGKRAIREALAPAINPNEVRKDDHAAQSKTKGTTAPSKKTIRPKGHRSWVYRDEVGRPTLEVHRTDDGKGKRRIWQESLIDGCRPRELANRVVPYGLSEAKQALVDGAPYVFIPEGEPCADALRRLGLNAVATLGGCKGFSPERDGGHFDPTRVVVVADQDQAGVKYARKVASAYPGCRWLLVYPGTPEWNGAMPKDGGLDVADWIADGASVEDLLKGVQENNPFLRQRPEPELSHLSELIAKPAQGGVRDLGKIWRVKQFAASGIVLLAADSGTGKTTLMNLCIEAIQEGTPFLGAFKTEQAKALLIQGDEPEKFAERKFRRQELRRNFDVIYPEGPFPLRQLFDAIESRKWGAIGIDSLTTVLSSEGHRTVDFEMIDLLYSLNKAAVNNDVLLLTTAHLNKTHQDGNGTRRKRTEIQWEDISGINTISAAVQDCWGLTGPKGEHLSLHALGKRNIEPGTRWVLQRDCETYCWWLADEQDQILPAKREEIAAKALKHLRQYGYKSINELAKTLKCNAEHLRLVCLDLFEQGWLQRHPRRTRKRGRPEYLYGVGDFSHVTHSPQDGFTAG